MKKAPIFPRDGENITVSVNGGNANENGTLVALCMFDFTYNYLLGKPSERDLQCGTEALLSLFASTVILLNKPTN